MTGGEVNVWAGGTASGITLVKGGDVTVQGSASVVSAVFGGDVQVASGGSVTDTTLGFLSYMAVLNGGTASNISLTGNFANLEIDSGTVTGSIDIAVGGLTVIQIDGTAMPAATISGFDGNDEIDLHGIAYDASGSAVYSAGTLTVSEDGQAYALNVAPAADYASGRFFLASDNDSGTEVEFVGASSLIVSSGQTSSSIAVPADAYLQVLSGGTSVATTLSGSGPFMTYQPSASDGGTLLINSSLAAYALETNLGIASGTQVGLGGNLINQGQAVSATVTSGGLMFNDSGTTLGTVVATSGIELDAGFASGAVVVSGSVIDGGLDGVAVDAVTVSAMVNSGGEQVVAGKVTIGGESVPLPGGTASGTTVNAGGQQFVNDEGVGSATVINAGGEMVVNSAGTADAPIIAGSGMLVLNSGASADDGIVFSGGTAVLEIAGTSMPATTISGFAATDTIDLANVSYGSAGSATLLAQNILHVVGPGATLDIQLDPARDYAGATFTATPDGGTGTDITTDAAPCLAAGTLIRTDHGEVPVEALRMGDRVVSALGGMAPVIWLGHRRVDCRRHPKPQDVWPVRVAVGAFAADQPRRDLWLSPDHAVYVDGVLIPVRYLVNGATIVQEPTDAVTYWHVELPQHNVLLAEGLPCESYLDTGNRGAFENGSGPTMLHPDFAMRVWEKASCAELVLGGANLEAARSYVHARAQALGFTLTSDADLHLVIDGRRVDAMVVAGGLYRFALPEGAQEVRIASRAAIPAEADILGTDTRRLGVMLDQVMLRRPPGQQCEISLGELPADAGFHALEVEGVRRWRWTDGHARLAIPPGYADGGRAVLDLHVAAVRSSWLHHGRPATASGEARKAA
jgi:autotransporter passenger strand-loop-strand repeat protein